jgi:1,4-dihydroxy-2-naphthoate octaprenyltransferase
VFALALVAGAYLTLVAGPVIVVIGVLSILAALAYTGGPYPLGYHGLGELTVMVFFGFVAVCGTAFVQAQSIPAIAWWCAVPVGGLASAILVVNNIRDRKTDAIAGKRTLAVRLGRRGAIAEYVVLLALAYVVPFVIVSSELAGRWALLPLVSVPLALRLALRVAKSDGTAFNEQLVGTARLLLVYGVLLAAGIVL